MIWTNLEGGLNLLFFLGTFVFDKDMDGGGENRILMFKDIIFLLITAPILYYFNERILKRRSSYPVDLEYISPSFNKLKSTPSF